MPLPLGHAALGATTTYFNTKKGSAAPSPLLLPYVTCLANLPDLDVIVGLIVTGNGSTFHRGPSHSILFALVAAWLATRARRYWRWLPDLPWRTCVLIILSHLLADFFCTSGPVSLFWPVTVHWSSESTSLGEIVNTVLFQASQDTALMVSCASLILMHRFLSPRKRRLRLLLARGISLLRHQRVSCFRVSSPLPSPSQRRGASRG